MFRGAMTALVTPFRDDDTIDEEALRRLVQEQIAQGIDALVPCGTTGESPTLSVEEQRRVVRIVVEEAKGKVPVIAGAGSNDTRHAAQLAEGAREAGADGLLVVTPYYNKPTPEGLVAHFREVSRAGRLPVVLYHVPGRTGLSISPQTLERVAKEVPDVVAVKEATGSIAVLQSFLARLSGRLIFLSGEDLTAFPFYAAGGEGTISVTSNVAPGRVAAIWDAYIAGDIARARAEHYSILPLHEAMFLETNPIPVKAALAMMGKIRPHLRLPLVPLAKENEDKLRAALTAQRLL